MNPAKQTDEPTGRMVNNHGHWEYRYDDPALNPPLPPKRPARPVRKLQAIASTCPDPALSGEPAPYTPAQLKPRHHGWTAERQRTFLTVLAETGCISEACGHAGVSSRSAYRLRQRADAVAFANAWDQALRLATLRLTTVRSSVR